MPSLSLYPGKFLAPSGPRNDVHQKLPCTGFLTLSIAPYLAEAATPEAVLVDLRNAQPWITFNLYLRRVSAVRRLPSSPALVMLALPLSISSAIRFVALNIVEQLHTFRSCRV